MNGAGEITHDLDSGRHQATDGLRDAMRAAGVEPPELIADGQVRRFDSPTDKRGRRSAWYILYPSGIAVFGSWKGDIAQQTVAPNGNGKLSKAVREDIRRATQQAEAERARLRAQAAVTARKLWASASPAGPKHSYLLRKRIQPHGIRQRGQTLYVPMYDVASQEIVNLQCIHSDGSKIFLKDGQAAGCYFPINDLGKDHALRMQLVEGFATQASVHEATKTPTATAFNAGNLLTVAEALHKKHPKARIVVCADDDHETPGNPGLMKASQAARAVGGLLAIPKFNDPAGKTDFNDLAIEQGLDAVREQISSAAPPDSGATRSENEIPNGFKLTQDTLYVLREVKVKDRTKVEQHPVCSRLEVVALTRDDSGGEWGRLLLFKDLDGCEHEWAMPTEMLAGEGTEYRARLWQQGLRIWPTKEARYGLHEYISQCQPAARARAVVRVGWHDGVFVLPDATFGDRKENERTLYQSAASVNHAFNVRGTLEDWQREISARCVGNSRLMFAVSAGFAPPLLHLTNDESGGFHFVGPSSLGKTTALRVGGSVWGGSHEPAGYLRQWRATANGLEGIAAMHCDTLLPLDEMGQVNAREAGEVGYLLANGQGKSRARRDGSARSPFTWRVMFLSSGEITLADKIREDGRQRATAGQRVRILDIPAEAGNFGLFENLHGAASGQEFADTLRNATQRNYGAAARAFLPEIAKRAERITDAVHKYRDDFIAQRLPTGASEQVGRAAARFGLVAAAGELATALGITGWDAGAAAKAAGACFEAWLTHRGHVGPAEIEAGIEQVRHFFALHGGSRFGIAEASEIDSHGRTVLNRAGFRKEGNFWVYPQVFRAELAAGYDWRALADALAARDLLKRDKDGKVQCPVRDPGSGKLIRMLCFMPTILGEEVTGDEG